MARQSLRDTGDDGNQPWLAEGVREEQSTLVPRARLFGGGLLAVGVVVLVGLGVYLASGHKSDGSSGYARPEDAPVIAADAGPYKIAPDHPGGAQITGIDDTIAATASGQNPGSAIAADTPEEPIARTQLGASPTPAPAVAAPTDLLPPAIPPATVTPLPSRPIVAAPVVAPKPAVAPPVFAKPASPLPIKPAVASAAKADAPKAKPVAHADADPLAPPVKADVAARAAKFDPAKADRPDSAKPDAAKPATGGSVVLQLGAFSSRDKAEAAWTKTGGDGVLARAGDEALDHVERLDRHRIGAGRRDEVGADAGRDRLGLVGDRGADGVAEGALHLGRRDADQAFLDAVRALPGDAAFDAAVVEQGGGHHGALDAEGVLVGTLHERVDAAGGREGNVAIVTQLLQQGEQGQRRYPGPRVQRGERDAGCVFEREHGQGEEDASTRGHVDGL